MINNGKQSKHEETSLQLPLQDVWSDEMILHNKRRYLPVHDTFESSGGILCIILPGAHA